MTLTAAKRHYEYTLARFDEADRDDRGWRRVAMERAKEELDRLTVEPPPNPSEELVRLQLLASVMLESLKGVTEGYEQALSGWAPHLLESGTGCRAMLDRAHRAIAMAEEA